MGIMVYALGMGNAGFLSSTVAPALGYLESWGKGFKIQGSGSQGFRIVGYPKGPST